MASHYICPPCAFTTVCPTELLLHKFNCVPFVLQFQMNFWEDFTDIRSSIRLQSRRQGDHRVVAPTTAEEQLQRPNFLITKSCEGCGQSGTSLDAVLHHKANCERFFAQALLGTWSHLAERYFEAKKVGDGQTNPKELLMRLEAAAEEEEEGRRQDRSAELQNQNWLESFVFVELE